MIKRQYYYLIAGLPDLALEQDVKNFDLQTLMDEIYEYTDESDHVFIRELFSWHELENLPNLQENREVWSQFYQNIEQKTKNKFIRSWFRFDALLRNIQSAWMCRKLGISMQEQLLGWNEEMAFFIKNNLPDFGLKREIALGEQIFNLLDENINILEREFRFDEIRWQMADELTTFHYFDIEKILAFLAKADILNRWLKLDKARGMALFDSFVKNLVNQNASKNSATEIKK